MKSYFSSETSIMYVEISRAADCITMALCHTVNTRTVDYYGGKIIYCTAYTVGKCGCRSGTSSTEHNALIRAPRSA